MPSIGGKSSHNFKKMLFCYWYCKLIRARLIILSWDEDENQTNHEDEKNRHQNLMLYKLSHKLYNIGIYLHIKIYVLWHF